MCPNPNQEKPFQIYLYLLGDARLVWQAADASQPLPIQPKPFFLLAYLALHSERPIRRQEIQALFWPDKSPQAAANNLRQALWHLRQVLPAKSLIVQTEKVQWNPDLSTWVDVLAFEAALEKGDLATALEIYTGPLLPNEYDEWVQLERERLELRYIAALETRVHQRYKARRWELALADAEKLLATDPLNETATRLMMACHWALDQREAARRCYQVFCRQVQRELDTPPLPETTALYYRILRGEPHPDQAPPPDDAEIATQRAHFSLLETLGAFRQGLELAIQWVASARGAALAEANRWQGCFLMHLGKLNEAREVLLTALPLATGFDLRPTILAGLAGVEIALGNYADAELYYDQALNHVTPNRARLLSSLGGLRGRLGRSDEARLALEEAIEISRQQEDLATLAIASGNLGILLIGQGEQEAAEGRLQEALTAARRADAHWLSAHCTGHLGVLAADRDDLEAAAQHYQNAYTLAEAIGDQRATVLWGLNLGTVLYEQGNWDQALLLLREGCQDAAEQGSRSLEAGANIFIGACLVAQEKTVKGLAEIEKGLSLAREIGDQERILMGILHQGRALAALGRINQARVTLMEGRAQAKISHMARLGDRIETELNKLPR